MESLLGLSLGFFSVAGGLGIAVYALWLDSKKRQLRHAERMAMIDKGPVPPGEVEANGKRATGSPRVRRGQRRSGVFMICIGIGLSMMFGLASGSWRNVWMGGLIALFGVATLVNALWDERDAQRQRPPNPQSQIPNP